MGTERLALKWGTLKGFKLETDASKAAMQKYLDAGEHSLSAMTQHDSAEQKALLCEVIDAIDGEIYNDWSGKTMTKDEAKQYVMEYDS